MILGTAAYMSPEQARGAIVDKRADIRAFGVVLHEILTGQRLFDGETVSDTLASVLKTDVDWSRLPAETPASVRRLLRHCLARDRRQRQQDIGDARLELGEGGTHDVVAALPAPPARSPWLRMAATLVAQTGERWQVSTDGATDARWRADGRELFYLSPTRELMAVSRNGFRAGTPVRLFQTGSRDHSGLATASRSWCPPMASGS